MAADEVDVKLSLRLITLRASVKSIGDALCKRG